MPRVRAALFACAASFVAVAAAGETPNAPAAPPLTAGEARAFLDSQLVASPYRLPASALAGEIRYRLAMPPDWRWPHTGEQRGIAIADAPAGEIELAVCADCGDEAPPSATDLQRFLRANAWVRSDDRRVRAFARANAHGRSADARMRALTAAVRTHMTGGIDFTRYDDAATALDSRSGDCTEFAVLLAATARAVGLPARIAHGLSYSGRMNGRPHVFVPHAWVQVWDGRRWASYDAALGQFDAGHIALIIGDGDPVVARDFDRAVRALRIVDAAGIARNGPVANRQ